MCIFDLTILWGIGGTALVFVGYRIYSSYKDAKKKPNSNQTTDKENHPISSE